MHKRYIMFGSGTRAKRVLKALGSINIEFIIDNDKNKWDKSTVICDKEYIVNSPEILLTEPLENLEILIGSTYPSEMISYLRHIATSCTKKTSVKAVELSDGNIIFDIFIVTFVNNADYCFCHDFSEIGTSKLVFDIQNKPRTIVIDKVLINETEEHNIQSIINTNGEWVNQKTIQFKHFNPTVYIDKTEGLHTIFAQYHFEETNYKKACEFMRGFYMSMSDFSNDVNPGFVCEEDFSVVSFSDNDVKPIAFYLPQFHQIPQNDEWWEKGFTEWTNVTKTYPLFEGHYQPHIPVDTSFYDLNNIAVQKRQISLAKKYGIYGFCYYYYHFENAKLMEMPLRRHLQNEEFDFPFCILWDNESWTRRWVGDDTAILRVGQSEEFYLNVIKSIAEYIKDTRYIRIDGKPLIIVYRPYMINNLNKMAEIWREYCRREGIGEICLMYIRPMSQEQSPMVHCFDSIIDFLGLGIQSNIRHLLHFYDEAPGINVRSYKKYVNTDELYQSETNNVYKTAFVNFDNSPRYKERATLYHGITPDLYKEHISRIISYTNNKHKPANRYMFIFAWNEWAESAHLEPDRKYGYAWLKATREAVLESRNSMISDS